MVGLVHTVMLLVCQIWRLFSLNFFITILELLKELKN